MERLYWLTEGWYWNMSLLLVPCTDSLNSLAEALRLKHRDKRKKMNSEVRSCVSK